MNAKPRIALNYLISAPFIYAVFFPVVLLDIFLELYHRVSFPLYGIPYVKRGDYIRIDRHKLSYLNWIEKFNCMYCGYVNGFFAYAVQVAGETEKYWCGIMHEKYAKGAKPAHHKEFLEYGDKKGFTTYVKKKDKHK